MPDIIADGVQWLQGFRKENLIEDVVYTRDASSAAIEATVGRSSSDDDTELGIIISSRSQDFIVEAVALETAGFGEPERGDQITRTVQGMEIVYEVAGEEGEPPWRPTSRYWGDVRIHTKRLSKITLPPAP